MSSTQPIMNIGGSVFKGTGGLASIGNVFRRNDVGRIVVDGSDVLQLEPASSEKADYSAMFDQWINQIKNTNALAIDTEDFAKVAEKWRCHVAWVVSVFKVESGRESYNHDGSVKALFERHVFRRQVLKHYKGHPKVIRAIEKELGLGGVAGAFKIGNLYSRNTGGYVGGLAEWERIKAACCAVARATGDFETALNLALSAASHGGPQILAKHAKFLGYGSPRKMVELMHQNEDQQLEAFCRFVEKNGLDKHLKAATGVSDPYKFIRKFAMGYNGRLCCDKSGKRKNYAAEIIRWYRTIAEDFKEFGSLGESRTIQGVVISTAANTSKALVATEATGVTSISDWVARAGEYKKVAETAVSQVRDLTGDVTALAAKNAELVEQLSTNKQMFYVLLALLFISQLGTLRIWWARISDRLRGYK